MLKGEDTLKSIVYQTQDSGFFLQGEQEGLWGLSSITEGSDRVLLIWMIVTWWLLYRELVTLQKHPILGSASRTSGQAHQQADTSPGLWPHQPAGQQQVWDTLGPSPLPWGPAPPTRRLTQALGHPRPIASCVSNWLYLPADQHQLQDRSPEPSSTHQ